MKTWDRAAVSMLRSNSGAYEGKEEGLSTCGVQLGQIKQKVVERMVMIEE